MRSSHARVGLTAQNDGPDGIDGPVLDNISFVRIVIAVFSR